MPVEPGVSYVWSGPGGFSATGASVIRGQATEAAGGVYSVTISKGGCASLIRTVSVAVHPSPSGVSIATNAPLCAGSNLELNASERAGATYIWSGPGGFSATGSAASVPQAGVWASGVYSLQVRLGGCSAWQTVWVEVNAVPAKPLLRSSSPVCSGSALRLTALGSLAARYIWRGPNRFAAEGREVELNGVSVEASGNYEVMLIENGCTSAAEVVPVTVWESPAAALISTNSPICEGGLLTLSASYIAGAVYEWSGPGGFSASGMNVSFSRASFSASGVYSLTITVGGCRNTQPLEVAVEVLPRPISAVNVSASANALCSGQSLSFFAETIAGGLYAWSGPGGFTSTLQNPVLEGVTTNQSRTYQLLVTQGGCSYPLSELTVSVVPGHDGLTAGSSGPVCSGSGLSLTASGYPGARFRWSGPGGFSSTQQNPLRSRVTEPDGGIYTVSAIVGGCTTVREVLVVVENCAGGKYGETALGAFALQVYPNPSGGLYTVSGVASVAGGILRGEIYDGSGRRVGEIEERVSSNFTLELDLRAYPSGIYRFRYSLEGSESGQVSLLKR